MFLLYILGCSSDFTYDFSEIEEQHMTKSHLKSFSVEWDGNDGFLVSWSPASDFTYLKMMSTSGYLIEDINTNSGKVHFTDLDVGEYVFTLHADESFKESPLIITPGTCGQAPKIEGD